ncbi:MAG: helix-turn-helix transcriptional regulator [Clostridia bacterium]|nr:helix-turn-helix transcriptional regulator [Clostridia bacterium]MBQ6808006.1 helix-turn-helix transcriptional regulator [Bacillota bacterium]
MNETCQKQWENMVNNLIRLRKEKGLSRREMARLLGIGPLMLAKIEQGTLSRRLSAEIFLAIEEVFGLLPSQILSS